ncbi:Aspartic proteinase nepenthesin-1 [Camellia lanceoleosa]|uniref:Aspartic proteinase nepenthesin-1 n=1 Tax=Camellia lanceoleosa TaxID=1840588 RepID=A0ACC0F7H8_9ERIC|nr:Aspartic proteinase nepenthesin-1 [Camellia lanceoleosa]
MTAPSIVRFGDDIARPRGNLIRTTRFPTNTFMVRISRIGGCIIDSGTPLTHIDQNANGINAYARVIRAFENYFSNLNLSRLANGHDNMELCYEYRQNFRQYASMTFNFVGADFDVDPNYVYYFNNARGYFCVALLPGNGTTTLGAYQQQNMRLIFNANIGSLQFVSDNCSVDHL